MHASLRHGAQMCTLHCLIFLTCAGRSRHLRQSLMFVAFLAIPEVSGRQHALV